MRDRYWDREREERGRRYRGEERDRGPGGDERGFFDRAGDEVRSWFGDEEAQRRRVRDERDERGRWPEAGGVGERGWGQRTGWPGRERGWGEERRGGEEEVDRDWARQWGYTEGRGGGPREADRGSARGWGYSGGYGAGAGYLGGRADEPGGRFEWSTSGWSGPGGHAPGQPTGGWRGVSPGPYVGRGPRGYQRADERIREDICEEMCQCGDLDATEIDVVVVSGEVTLQGTVVHRRAKRLAEDLAEQVSGVREVNNQIRVTPGGGQPDRPDHPFRAA